MPGRKRDPYMQKELICETCNNSIRRLCYMKYNKETRQPTYIRTNFWLCPTCKQFFETDIKPIPLAAGKVKDIVGEM